MFHIFLILFALLAGCEHKNSLKIAASSVPHAEILEFIEPQLKERGIQLEIIVVDDYQLPNRMLADGEVDANFFQHKAFFDSQVKEFHYDFVILTEVHSEPLGLYSLKKTLGELEKRATIAIPSDPSNEKRALLLLECLKLLDLKGNKSSLLDIENNPFNIQLKEIDAALLVSLLPDVDFAIIPGNYIMQSRKKLQPLALELQACNLYPNIIAIRKGDENREDLKIVAQLLHSESVKKFIESKYKDSVKLCL